MGERGIAAGVHEEESRGPDDQTYASSRTEHHGKTRVSVRSDPAEYHVVDRSDRRRCKAQEKSVERAVVHPTPPRPPRLLRPDAVLAAGVKMPQCQHVA